MEQELIVRLNSLEKRLKECEEPATMLYCRPGSKDHESLVDFLNDTYIQLQEVRAVVEMTARDSKVHLAHKLCQH
jgi:hypothetical protein